MFNTIPFNPFPPSTEQEGTSGGSGSYTPPSYSTTEQKTGQKWIDGKDIYAIVVNCGTLPNNTTKSVETGINPDTVVNVRGVAFDNNYLLPMPYFTDINVYFNRTDNKLYFTTQKDMSNYTNCYMFIEYTKTESEE